MSAPSDCDCARCKGTGSVPAAAEPRMAVQCPDCKGFGQFTACPLCGGTGCWDCTDGRVAGP